jgi:hypothetical protein
MSGITLKNSGRNKRGPMRHITEAKRKGKGGSYLVDSSTGEFNAGSKKDLMNQILTLASLVESGDVDNSENVVAASSRERAKELAAAYRDTASGDFRELGAALAGKLQENADREGFARNILARAEVAEGSDVRHRVKSKSLTAIVASSATQMDPQTIREKEIYPREFMVRAKVRIEELQLRRGSQDLLEEKFFEAQEQIMRTEDLIVKKMMDQAVGAGHNVQYISGGLTPSSLGDIMGLLSDYGLQPVNMMFANNLLRDMITSQAFSEYFDPLSKYEIVQTGTIGSIFAMDIRTDAYRDPNLRVLEKGEIYIVPPPEWLGAYTDRGPVEAKELNDDDASRGWSFFEIMSFALHNPKAVVKAIRL